MNTRIWVTRDYEGILDIHFVYPTRMEYHWESDERRVTIDGNDFPDLKWDDEPQEVCLCLNDDKYHTVQVKTLDSLYTELEHNRELVQTYNLMPWYKKIFKFKL